MSDLWTFYDLEHMQVYGEKPSQYGIYTEIKISHDFYSNSHNIFCYKRSYVLFSDVIY